MKTLVCAFDPYIVPTKAASKRFVAPWSRHFVMNDTASCRFVKAGLPSWAIPIEAPQIMRMPKIIFIIIFSHPTSRLCLAATVHQLSAGPRTARQQPLVGPYCFSLIAVLRRYRGLGACRCQTNLNDIAEILNISVLPQIMKLINHCLSILDFEQRGVLPHQIKILYVICLKAWSVFPSCFGVNSLASRYQVKVILSGCSCARLARH